MKKTLLALLCGVGFLTTANAGAQVTDQQFADLMKKYIATEGGRKEVGGAMEKYFMEKQQRAAVDQQKRDQEEVEKQFKNPVKVDVGTSPVRGNPNAKVTIVEFSDFQCPFCKRGSDTMDRVLKEYPNDVKIAFKNLPLPMHPEAKPASQAALAAGKQGKFWEMYHALFENQQGLNKDFYAKKAADLKLDVEKFKKDFESEEVKKQIEADMKLAEQLGINATPGFFVNGVAVKGAYPFEHFKTIVDRHLGKK